VPQSQYEATTQGTPATRRILTDAAWGAGVFSAPVSTASCVAWGVSRALDRLLLSAAIRSFCTAVTPKRRGAVRIHSIIFMCTRQVRSHRRPVETVAILNTLDMAGSSASFFLGAAFCRFRSAISSVLHA
jgi:hypothetical protein